MISKYMALLLLSGLLFTQPVGAQLFGGSIKANSQYRLPPTVTLGQIQTYMVASVYDADYLPYTAPTAAANTSAKPADGTAESKIIDYQGSISTSGVSIRIPLTATADGTFKAFSGTVDVPASMTQDGNARTLVLSWNAQSYTSSTTSFTATLKAVGGTLYVKKLDINGGIGNDCLGLLLGTIAYPYSGTQKKNFQLRAISCIPDKKFYQYDLATTTEYEHNFLYIPIVGEDGRIWLNNNLGAPYSDIDNANFNVAKQATSNTDLLATGSCFQWGRKADGHELMDWPNAEGRWARKYRYDSNGRTGYLIDEPIYSMFIDRWVEPYDWRITAGPELWLYESSANNPCPKGFRVPTMPEYETYKAAAKVVDMGTAFDCWLKLTAGGETDFQEGSNNKLGSWGKYWTSTAETADTRRSSYLIFQSNGAWGASNGYRVTGMSIRCIKD